MSNRSFSSPIGRRQFVQGSALATGAFFINSFFSRDYTMMMGMVLFYSVLLQGLNMVSDLMLRWLDPRIRP